MSKPANLTDQELKDHGNKLFAARKYEDAISCYSKAIVSCLPSTLVFKCSKESETSGKIIFIESDSQKSNKRFRIRFEHNLQSPENPQNDKLPPDIFLHNNYRQ